MALINCPECGGKVSDKATACIHCGYIDDMIHIAKVMEFDELIKRLIACK